MKKRKWTMSQAQRAVLFSLAAKAASNLGEKADEYRHQVMLEELGIASSNDLRGNADYDVLKRRFEQDAGDYLAAIETGVQDVKRRAYNIKVICLQLMQLKGLAETGARDYLNGVLKQSRIMPDYSQDSYYMDVSRRELSTIHAILDTERRKLIRKYFATTPLSLQDTLRFEIDGPIAIKYECDRSYYAKFPFTVHVKEAC